MATYSSVIKGLSLFMELEGDKHNVTAEHDVLYAAHRLERSRLTAEQLSQLEEWGWFEDEELGGWKKFV